MRQYINNNWNYYSTWEDKLLETTDLEGGESVRIPHQEKELPYHYFSEEEYEGVSGYIREIHVLKEWEKKRVFVTFEAVAHVAQIYLMVRNPDGTNQTTFLMEHKGGYTSFTVEITEYLKNQDTVWLIVKADSRESSNIPPFGKVIDYMTYQGIYREVYLEVKEETYLSDVFITTTNTTKTKKTVTANIDIAEFKKPLKLIQQIRKVTQEEKSEFSICYEGELINKESTICYEVEKVECWDIEHPVLYEVLTQIYDDEHQLDEVITRIGFREVEFKKDGFYLNGKKVILRGLNRHQSYPYVGYAMPKRAQQTDADILKYELCVNAVRTSHYPQSHHFIDRCDELGLLVFTEIPGWQNLGDKEWKDTAIESTKEMIVQYRNHPSIIIWGVRINESMDDDELYQKTNELARGLDPSRSTGGVRFIRNSNLLEDVYTFNDFSFNGKRAAIANRNKVTKRKDAPYLISEFNGHMYPTKSFDEESHRIEHARRHAAVLEELYHQKDIAGGFGWCMFDYNTHQEFGSGDRICYHGVMDMFRNPKLAARVYESQGEENIMLSIGSDMNIGEYPGCYMKPFPVYTNADSVRVYKNDEFIKEFYPDRKTYGHLSHPPIIIDDLIGTLIESKEKLSHRHAEMVKKALVAAAKYGQDYLPLSCQLRMGYVMLLNRLSFSDAVRFYSDYMGNWGGDAVKYRFEAIKDGKITTVVEKCPQNKIFLSAVTDTTVLKEAETYDVASIRIRALGENGEIMPYYQEPVTIQIDGPAKLIGPDTISLKGGMGGCYIKTVQKTGIVTVTMKSLGAKKEVLTFRVLA